MPTRFKHGAAPLPDLTYSPSRRKRTTSYPLSVVVVDDVVVAIICRFRLVHLTTVQYSQYDSTTVSKTNMCLMVVLRDELLGTKHYVLLCN